MNGFFLYSLLLDCFEANGCLILPHDASSQSERLDYAMHRRNKAMEGIGQECWSHACSLCFQLDIGEDGQPRMLLLFPSQLINTNVHSSGKLQFAVGDGVTLGHPCCSVHDCHIPLSSTRDRFCPEHKILERSCAVVGCTIPHSPGMMTCENPAHRQLEDRFFRHDKALFKLRAKLKKKGLAVPSDSARLDGSTAEDDASEEREGLHEEEECSGKPESGNAKLRSTFSRRRTHNEQLIMRPCSIILSRATFFGSESVSAVKVSLSLSH